MSVVTPNQLPAGGLSNREALDPSRSDGFSPTPRPRFLPREVLVTRDAAEEPFTEEIVQRMRRWDVPITYLRSNRLMGLKDDDPRREYARAKRTLAVVNAPNGQFKLQPIPPSADYQFHLAQGCPAHCQYCYLAGSLSGPPITRVYANLPAILSNLRSYTDANHPRTFEASCYTDPLAIEPLSGSLFKTIQWFGDQSRHTNAHSAGGLSLRWVTKFDAVESLLAIDHRGATQCRFSVNADEATGKLEGGTASVSQRVVAARELAEAGYPIGFVVAPIMPTDNWQTAYAELFDQIANEMPVHVPLTFELITHRFTPKSREVLLSWYPKTKLDLDDTQRVTKRNKFGGEKYVYSSAQMKSMRTWFELQIRERFRTPKVLYWT